MTQFLFFFFPFLRTICLSNNTTDISLTRQSFLLKVREATTLLLRRLIIFFPKRTP